MNYLPDNIRYMIKSRLDNDFEEHISVAASG